MVYGRYNKLVFMGIIMVYKPTYITGGGAILCKKVSLVHQKYWI